jgi:hypothetical protein
MGMAHHDRETARHQRQPGPLGSVTQHRLHEKRQQQRAAEQRKSQHEHQEVGGGEGVAKQMQVDDGILVPPLPEDHEDQRHHRDGAQPDDEVRFEPVFALPFVEDHLQRSQAERNKPSPV